MLRLYIADVVDNKDPLFQGRIKVSINSLVEEPFWVLPLLTDNYTFAVPEVGSRVVVLIIESLTSYTGFYLGQAFNDLPKQFVSQHNLCLYPLYNKKAVDKKFEYNPDNTSNQARFKFLHRDEFLTMQIYSLPISESRVHYDEPKDLYEHKDKTIAFLLSNRSSFLEFKTHDKETSYWLNLHAPYKKVNENKVQCKNFSENYSGTTTKLQETLYAGNLAKRHTLLQIYDSSNSLLNEMILDTSHAEYKLVLTHNTTTVYIEAKNDGHVIIKCKDALVQASDHVTIDTPLTTITGDVHIGGNVSIAKNLDVADTITCAHNCCGTC